MRRFGAEATAPLPLPDSAGRRAVYSAERIVPGCPERLARTTTDRESTCEGARLPRPSVVDHGIVRQLHIGTVQFADIGNAPVEDARTRFGVHCIDTIRLKLLKP